MTASSKPFTGRYRLCCRWAGPRASSPTPRTPDPAMAKAEDPCTSNTTHADAFVAFGPRPSGCRCTGSMPAAPPRSSPACAENRFILAYQPHVVAAPRPRDPAASPGQFSRMRCENSDTMAAIPPGTPCRKALGTSAAHQPHGHEHGHRRADPPSAGGALAEGPVGTAAADPRSVPPSLTPAAREPADHRTS